MSELPSELADRGIGWQVGGFVIVGCASVAVLWVWDGSDFWAYRIFEIAVKDLYWAFILPMAWSFSKVRRMFEKRSEIRAAARREVIEKALRKARPEILREARPEILREAREEVQQEVRQEVQREMREEIQQAVRQAAQQARQETQQEMRQRHSHRMSEAVERFGVANDGVPILALTPEVVAFLSDEPDDE